MKMKSVATKNNLILILSLTPFIISLIFSIYKSSDTEYLSRAINLSGSQRMRTMLLANYAQQLSGLDPSEEEHVSEVKEILIEESLKYERFYRALLSGDAGLDVKKNPFSPIVLELEALAPQMEAYMNSVLILLEDPSDIQAKKYLMDHAMTIKNQYHVITNLYQEQNDRYIYNNRNIDTVMLIFASSVTLVGLGLTQIIKRHEYLANHDHLTGLANRQSFYAFIKGKKATNYTILFIDLNKFKSVNDTHGHDIGDEILKETADRLKQVFDGEALFRYGGDEFVVLMNGVGKKRLSSHGLPADWIDTYIKASIESTSESMIDSNGFEHHITLSIGATSHEVGIDDWDTLLSISDKLMYRSKTIQSQVTVAHSKEEVDQLLQEMREEAVECQSII